jgi:hypothetical protein
VASIEAGSERGEPAERHRSPKYRNTIVLLRLANVPVP